MSKTKWIYLRSETAREGFGLVHVTGQEAEKAATQYGMVAPHATEEGTVIGKLNGYNSVATWYMYKKEVPVF